MKNKIALSHHDDKRFLIPNTTKTLPWGHDDIIFYQADPELNVQNALSALESVYNDCSQPLNDKIVAVVV